VTIRIDHAASTSAARPFDVICIGTALIDHLSFAELPTVAELGLAPGTMTLIDDGTAARARATLGEGQIVSGGTVANTAAGIASFAGRTAFVGAVAPDAFGERYAADLAEAGVVPMLNQIATQDGSGATGACYVMVTPDQQRTMATHLGVSGQLAAHHLDDGLLASCSICYFDSYLLDFPGAEEIVDSLVVSAQRHGTALALGLADPFVVDRHRDAIVALLPHVSLLFSNQDEITMLGGTPNFEAAAERHRHEDLAVVVTRSEHGAYVVWPEGSTHVDAVPVEQVIDVTGAGDLFAAGMLYGCVRNLGFEAGARLGALAASEVISHLGARPMHSLAELARGRDLLP
jgi:sugar/nucleoside kinase (ribokinase family)